MPRKIFYLITNLHIGGTEKQLFDLIKRLDKAKFTPIACSLKGRGNTAQKISAMGHPVYACGMPDNPFLRPIAFWLSLKKLASYIQDTRPDIIHTLLFRANFFGRLIGRLLHKEKIVSTVGVWDERRIPLALEKITLPWAKRITFNSHWVARKFQNKTQCDPNVIRVIPNGVELEPFREAAQKRESTRGALDIPSDCKLVLSIGRLDKQKGFAYLIDAFAKLLEKGRNARLIIAGGGPLEISLQTQIAKLQRAEEIKLLGFRKDTPELLAASDCFVLPSLWEGSPNVILEAMAAGIPIVATNIGGTAELINDGKEGILVAPANANALTEGLERLLQNGQLAKNLGAAAIQKAKLFSPENRAQDFQKIYDDLLT